MVSKKYWREIDPLAYAFIVLELCCDSFRPCPPYSWSYKSRTEKVTASRKSAILPNWCCLLFITMLSGYPCFYLVIVWSNLLASNHIIGWSWGHTWLIWMKFSENVGVISVKIWHLMQFVFTWSNDPHMAHFRCLKTYVILTLYIGMIVDCRFSTQLKNDWTNLLIGSFITRPCKKQNYFTM